MKHLGEVVRHDLKELRVLSMSPYVFGETRGWAMKVLLSMVVASLGAATVGAGSSNMTVPSPSAAQENVHPRPLVIFLDGRRVTSEELDELLAGKYRNVRTGGFADYATSCLNLLVLFTDNRKLHRLSEARRVENAAVGKKYNELREQGWSTQPDSIGDGPTPLDREICRRYYRDGIPENFEQIAEPSAANTNRPVSG